MESDVEMVRALIDYGEFLRDRMLSALVDAGYSDVSRSQVAALAFHDAYCTPAQLARQLGVTRQSMQKTLRLLVAEDLVRLEPHPTDRRSKHVVLTPKGEQARQHLARALDGFGRRLDAAFGTETMYRVGHVLTSDWREILRTTS